MSTGKVVLGALAGIAIGAIAGILFAPGKGSAIRRKILGKGGDYTDELKSKYDEFCDTLMEEYEAAKKDAKDTISKGRTTYEEVKRDLRKATSDAKHDGAVGSKNTAA